jgi:hypothetical protein
LFWNFLILYDSVLSFCLRLAPFFLVSSLPILCPSVRGAQMDASSYWAFCFSFKSLKQYL